VAVSFAPQLSAHDLSVLFDFLLFAATLACVAIFHRHTLAAAVTGLGVITVFAKSKPELTFSCAISMTLRFSAAAP
jgi:hypothetical protein